MLYCLDEYLVNWATIEHCLYELEKCGAIAKFSRFKVSLSNWLFARRMTILLLSLDLKSSWLNSIATELFERKWENEIEL